MLLAITVMIINVQGSDDVARIVALINRAEKAFNDGDLDEFVSLYTEDCRFFTPGLPEVRGRAGQLTPTDIKL